MAQKCKRRFDLVFFPVFLHPLCISTALDTQPVQVSEVKVTYSPVRTGIFADGAEDKIPAIR